MSNQDVKDFWALYDLYILNSEKRFAHNSQRFYKSRTKDKSKQLLRPEKVGRTFLPGKYCETRNYFYRKQNFTLFEGEILAWTPTLG